MHYSMLLDKPTQLQVSIPLDLSWIDLVLRWASQWRRWHVFQSGSKIDDQSAAPHLFQCASDGLGDALLKVDAEITTKSLDILMTTMKSLAIIPVATGVVRAELLDMKQKRDEPFRSFSSRVRGKAETCGFSTTSVCDCGKSNSVDYTDYIIRDVLVAGIYDADIRIVVLGVDITDKSVNEVIGLVEKREMARDAHNVSANMSSFSTYRKEVRKVPVPRKSPGPPPGFSDTCTASRTSECVPCPQCGNQFTHFTEGRNGVVNSTPFEVCIDCFRSKRQRSSEAECTCPC